MCTIDKTFFCFVKNCIFIEATCLTGVARSRSNSLCQKSKHIMLNVKG